jgi:prepilin-type N-terminal cleavage/methylation domain-containing protein
MNKKGFTLLEILLSLTLITFVVLITISLINPGQQVADVNNVQRQADILNIYTAINQYREANNGILPAGINTTAINICQVGCTENSSQIDISLELNPYLRLNTLPIDPLQTGSILTGYTVYVDSQSGRVVVSAPLAENNIIINTIE